MFEANRARMSAGARSSTRLFSTANAILARDHKRLEPQSVSIYQASLLAQWHSEDSSERLAERVALAFRKGRQQARADSINVLPHTLYEHDTGSGWLEQAHAPVAFRQRSPD
jgi:hypothetical protein